LANYIDIVLYVINKTKYVDIAIAGRDKILRIVVVLANKIHHATIRIIGHTTQSISVECNVAWRI
jgi:hypothetical protein